MKRIVLALCFAVVAIAAAAQGTLKIKVKDKQLNDALPYVSVRVNDASTGQFVRGGITDTEGACLIEGLKYGKYVAVCSYTGYKDVSRTFTITKDDSDKSFPLIYMSEDSKMLKEVQVTGQRSQMKLEVDRKTFTVDEVIAAAGGTASELLENIPSIEVSTEGEISLRGNTSVEVWINGKASGLTSDNRGDILEQIPAESIERIEVIDNPSAKYSPEGSAGIINIILKRDRKAGYYGSARVGANTRGGWNAGANINYSSGSLEAFGNIGFRKRKHERNSLSETTYKNNNQYQNYESESENGGQNLFARAGLTWHMTKNDELSLTGMTMQGNHESDNITPYHYGTIGAPTDTRILYRQNISDGDMRMYYAELAYKHTFAEGHTLDANLSYGKWKSDNESYYRDSTLWMDGITPTEYLYQERPQYINNDSWEVKLDYENRFSETFKFEAGYNGRFSHENTPQMSWIDEGSFYGANKVEDKEFFNRFIYDNDVHALYLTTNLKFGRFDNIATQPHEY